MTRFTISVPDDIAKKIEDAASGNVSAWFTRIARDEFLRDEVAAVAAFEREHRDLDWDAERFAA